MQQSFHSPVSSSPVAAALSSVIAAGDHVRQALGVLLTKAYTLPCSAAAQAYTQIVQPTARFQLALDALLPLLDSGNGSVELSQRILAAFILYALYAPHPIAINPFKSVLFVVFVRERQKAVGLAQGGDASPNEQLVWVLWKILKGDGNDIGPYSPSTLARSPLPPKLRANNLTIDDEMYNNVFQLDDVTYSNTYLQQHNIPQRQRSASSDRSLSRNGNISPQNMTRPSGLFEGADRTNDHLAQAMKLFLGAKERTLTLSEQRIIAPLIPDLASSQMIVTFDLASFISYNPTLAHPLFVGLLKAAKPDHLPSPFLDVLPFLPPTLPTFDLLGRLLRDQTSLANGAYTVADVVRIEILGRFIHECMNWLDHAERDELEGLISDDRFTKGVQNLCRFYLSLIKLGIVEPGLDADSAEMAHFSLRNARLEDANALYRALALGKF